MNIIIGHKHYQYAHLLLGILSFIGACYFANLTKSYTDDFGYGILIVGTLIWVLPLVWLNGKKKDYDDREQKRKGISNW